MINCLIRLWRALKEDPYPDQTGKKARDEQGGFFS